MTIDHVSKNYFLFVDIVELVNNSLSLKNKFSPLSKNLIFELCHF